MTTPTVLLNHFYLTLDRETFQAIAQCEFLRHQFAPNEIRTTHRTDQSYTGLYFYGERTYFEFFDVTTETHRQIGDSAIAFGLENEGDTTLLESHWPDSHRLSITRPTDTEQVPWFEMLIPKGFTLEHPLTFWTMEYHPTFLTSWFPTVTAAPTLARQEVLERYKSRIGEVAHPYFKNISGLTIGLPAEVYQAVDHFTHQFGYAKKATSSGFFFTDVEDVTYHIQLSENEHYGISEVVFEVTGQPSQADWKLGNSELRFFNDQNAVWKFW